MGQFHQHGLSQELKAKAGKPPGTIENVLEAAEIGGVDISVISNPLHNLRDMDRKQQLALCQAQNRYLAEQQSKYHGQVYGMASTVPYGGDEFLREFERAIKQDGLKGAWILRACRASIPTTTRRCRSSSSRRNSTCRSSSIRRRSASARSACATIASPPASDVRWTVRLRWRG